MTHGSGGVTTIDIAQLVANSARRLAEARVVADDLRHNDDLHRLAMKAVFLFEDCYESFRRLQAEAEEQRA